jgi:hypothetical protein
MRPRPDTASGGLPRESLRLPLVGRQSELLEIGAIRRLVDERPTYGYRGSPRSSRASDNPQGQAPVNIKRVYRLMKKHGPLLECHTGRRLSREWRRSTRIADVGVAFALATPAGISAR